MAFATENELISFFIGLQSLTSIYRFLSTDCGLFSLLKMTHSCVDQPFAYIPPPACLSSSALARPGITPLLKRDRCIWKLCRTVTEAK